MKFRNAMLAAVSVATVTAVALAYEIVVKSDPLNVVESRIVGAWTMDTALTRKLDPNQPTNARTSLVFQSNPDAIGYLQSGSDRFKDLRIYGAGVLQIDGANSTHPYLIYNENGNMKLFWCTPRGDDPIGVFETKTLQIAVARDRAQDVLILGGDTKGETSAAYGRTP